MATETNVVGPKQRTLDDTQQRGIITYAQQCNSLLISQMSLRTEMEDIDRTYMREKNYTKSQWLARLGNRYGDSRLLQDVTVPIVMPQVKAAQAYMADVFCTGYPIFGVTADPANADAALQMQTIIAENAETAAWTRQLLMFFMDGLKYNIHGLEVDWTQKTTYSIDTDASASYKNGAKPRQVIWNGNKLNRLDMYNTFFDPRVSPAEIHEYGEFAGYVDLYSKARLMKYFRDYLPGLSQDVIKRALQTSNVGTGFNTGAGPFGYYIPLINPFPMMNQLNNGMIDWMSWATDSVSDWGDWQYNGMYQVLKMYARIIPAQFGFMDAVDKYGVQVWKFIIINGQVCVCAEPMTNAHDWIPMVFGQPNEDGLRFQTKSFAQDVSPMQDIASAMWNAYIAAKRRQVADRLIYNPALISKADIATTDPAARIPLRPNAYSKDLSEAVHQLPYNDGGAVDLLNGASIVSNMADKINGQNPAVQGQFVKGNKTQAEYEDTMGHGNGRNQLMALNTEFQVFGPVKHMLKLNILQYQPEGVIYNAKIKQGVKINPVALRQQAVHFEVSDGLTPKDKLMSADEWQVALQTVASSPNIGSDYNVGDMAAYLFKERNVDMTPFAKSPLQRMYEQQLASWQQVAMAAIKMGQQPPPQPQPSPALVQEQQAKAANGGVLPVDSGQAVALNSTVGTQTPEVAPSGQTAQ